MALIKFPTKSLNTDSVNPFVSTVFDNLFNDSFISDRLMFILYLLYPIYIYISIPIPKWKTKILDDKKST